MFIEFQVQAVLLLLGGYEVPAGIPTVSVAAQSQRVFIFISGIHSFTILLGFNQLLLFRPNIHRLQLTFLED